MSITPSVKCSELDKKRGRNRVFSEKLGFSVIGSNLGYYNTNNLNEKRICDSASISADRLRVLPFFHPSTPILFCAFASLRLCVKFPRLCVLAFVQRLGEWLPNPHYGSVHA